jgi:hypothetical protein
VLEDRREGPGARVSLILPLRGTGGAAGEGGDSARAGEGAKVAHGA